MTIIAGLYARAADLQTQNCTANDFEQWWHPYFSIVGTLKRPWIIVFLIYRSFTKGELVFFGI